MQLAVHVPQAYFEKPVKVDVDEPKKDTKVKTRSTRTSQRAASSPTPGSAFGGAGSLRDRSLDLIVGDSRASSQSSKRRRTEKDTSGAAQRNSGTGGSSAGGSGRAR